LKQLHVAKESFGVIKNKNTNTLADLHHHSVEIPLLLADEFHAVADKSAGLGFVGLLRIADSI